MTTPTYEDETFADWVRLYEPELLKTAESFATPSVGAEDIVQAAYVVACSRLHRLKNPKAARSWLRRIVRTVGLQVARRHVRRVGFQEAYLSTLPTTTGRYVSLSEGLLHARLRSALENLSERQRSIVVHRWVEGLSVEETADVVGCAVGTVKSATSRVRRILREQLGESRSEALGYALASAEREPT